MSEGFLAGVDYTRPVRLPGFPTGTPSEIAGWLNTHVGPTGKNWVVDPGGRYVVLPVGLDKFGVNHKNRPLVVETE